MPDVPELSESKRALLEKYLRGEISAAGTPKSATRDDGRSGAAPAPIRTPAVTDTPATAPAAERNAGVRVPIVPIRSSGSKRPFFYSHVHVDGGAFYCFALADRLGPDQPFYILEPYRMEGDDDIPPALEDMATAYIESMRVIQPRGPYLLGGFCGGGMIVFEMARQLRAQGERVDLLLLVEAVGGPGPASVSMILRGLAGKFLRGLAGPLHLSRERQITWYLRMRHYFLLLRYADYRKRQKKWLRPPLALLKSDWIGIFSWLLSAYTPVKFPGTVTYLWAEHKTFGQRDWKRNHPEAARREVHTVPGNHSTCRTEYLADLAGCINECVTAAQSARS